MPPSLALLAGLGLSLTLILREEIKGRPVSAGSWLPTFWMCIVGSRMVGQWLAVLGLGGGVPEVPEDGSSLDAAVFLTLILGGMAVLAYRAVRPGIVARQNVWLLLFVAYGFIAILWSDFPFIAFKRWIKTLGHPIMALVILTDRNPGEALQRVIKRFAFLHVPLSIVVIKYFPAIGRGFDHWTGMPEDHGINVNKNELGYVCMLLAIFFAWSLFFASRTRGLLSRGQEILINVGFLLMVGWLLYRADSATSLVCSVLGIATLLLLKLPLVSPRRVGTYVVLAVVVVFVLETTFDLYEQLIVLLGRDPTLTDRTEVWADLLAFDINPVLGAGFETFWLGERREALWAKWWWQPNQAHNGYLETYLNLGMVGVALLVAMCVSAYRKSQAVLVGDRAAGAFRLAILFAVLTYNYTEATFKAVHLVWTFFHFAALDYVMPVRRIARKRQSRPKRRRRELAGATQGTDRHEATDEDRLPSFPGDASRASA
ncbi:MAG TPA: O-antigen ligase family protein [Vicinamibacterales bacterium]